MKILQINSVCGVGSTGRIATDLYKVLEEQGHECVIAYGRGTAPEGIKSIKIGSNIDNYIHVAKTRIFDKHGFGSTRATKEFIKKVEEYNPDIIHLHNIHGYYINIELLFNYLKKANKPVVWTLHDCWALTGHCSHFDYIGCEKWKSGCYNCEQKREYPSSMALDNSMLNYKKKKELFNGLDNMNIVVVSDWLKSVVELSILKENNITVIKNGIDLNVFKPTDVKICREKYNLGEKNIILGMATTWDTKKGLEDFVKLSEKIDENSIIVLVGLNEKQMKNLPSNIIGIKRTENIDELVELYSCADVFINASVEESFGLVTVEAMACGTPAIVYNATASPELIDDKCGFVVETKNIEELFFAIEKVINRGKFYYSENCINRVRDNYNKIDLNNKYLDLYKRVIVK